VAVAESAAQADMWSVFIRTTVGQYSTDTQRRAGFSAIAEPLVMSSSNRLITFKSDDASNSKQLSINRKTTK